MLVLKTLTNTSDLYNRLLKLMLFETEIEIYGSNKINTSPLNKTSCKVETLKKTTYHCITIPRPKSGLIETKPLFVMYCM